MNTRCDEALKITQRTAGVRPRSDHTRRDPFSSRFWLLTVIVCGVAISSVPVFSHQVGLSHIAQMVALAAVGLAVYAICVRASRVHPAIIAYLALVAFWAPTYDNWNAYFTLVKVAMLALAVHMVVRTPSHLLVVFGIYSVCGLVGLLLNWADIREMQTAMIGGEQIERFDGTFRNANTAGMYGILICLCGVVVFFNSRHRFRWLPLVIGLLAGVTIGGLSGSRKAMLGLVLVALAAPALAMAGSRGGMLRWAKGMLIMAVALGGMFAILSQFPHFERLNRLLESGVQDDRSAEARLGMFKTTIEVWAAHPITGAGFDGFRRASGLERYSHTTFGEVLANGGLIGFTLISIFYFLPVWQLVRMSRGHHPPEIRKLAVGMLAFWMVIVLYSVFAVLYSSRDMIPLCAAVCGVLQQYKANRSMPEHPSRRRRRIPQLPARERSAAL